jgi:hypothetical protein
MASELNTDDSTLAICQKVVEILKPDYEGTQDDTDKVASVGRYYKRFYNKDDVQNNLTERGWIHLTCLNIKNLRREAGQTLGTLQLIAFVLTDDLNGENRAQRAELIASRLGAQVVSPTFTKALGSVIHKPITKAKCRNLNNQTFDDLQIAVWEVEWQQECRLNIPLDISSLDAFETYDLTANQAAGAPTLAADIQLEQNQ